MGRVVKVEDVMERMVRKGIVRVWRGEIDLWEGEEWNVGV